MASDAAQPIEDMGTAHLAGRNVLEMSTIRQLSGRSDLQGLTRFVGHFGYLCLTGALIWFTQSNYWLLVPAMILHGVGIVTMFAPMHECAHRTAFESRWLNQVFGWIAGALCFYNYSYFRKYHTLHHRHTQDHKLDPKLASPKPNSFKRYLLHISGLPFWISKPKELLVATGILGRSPYLTEQSVRQVAISATAQWVLYLLLLVGSISLKSNVVLLYWLLPAVLAQPFLRVMLIVEHTGCTHDENGLTNTRTTLASWPVRFLMWNMPFHAEHHLYPSVPFFQLSAAHSHIRTRLQYLASSYPAAHREVVHSLGATFSDSR